MLYLFLDESGDLGFDFVQKKPSKYFVITILAVVGANNRRILKNAVRRTLRNKLNIKKRSVTELKAKMTTLAIKQYAYRQTKKASFSVYSVILDKKKSYQYLVDNKAHVYNYITRQLLDQIPVEDATDRVELVVDRCKSRDEIKEFNEYIITHLQGRITPSIPLQIYHKDSQEAQEIQWADLFAWGILRKYERQDQAWYEVFAEKIKYEQTFSE